MEYEYEPEDKKRRYIIPTRDFRLAVNWSNRYERISYICVHKLRQGYDIFTKHVRSQQMVWGVIGFLITVWLSGWFANANSDMRFESLLSLVLGVIILAVIASRGTKK